MLLDCLQRRLVEVARTRVHAGEMTERGLARLCGLSQPHMHNVLKGIRALSISSADSLLAALGMSVPELIWQGSGLDSSLLRPVPLLHNRIGPGTAASLSHFNGYSPFPAQLINSLIEPVAARIAPDLVLPKCVAANDLALLDQNPLFRERPMASVCSVVSDSGGLRIRYVRVEGSRIFIANESNVMDAQAWRSYPLQERGILGIVKARVVWIGRELIVPGSSG